MNIALLLSIKEIIMNKEITLLHNVFSYNAIKYSELTSEKEIQIIDKMVIALNERPFGELILLQGDDTFFNIINRTNRQSSIEFETNIAADLCGKICIIYKGVAFPSSNSLYATGNY